MKKINNWVREIMIDVYITPKLGGNCIKYII